MFSRRNLIVATGAIGLTLSKPIQARDSATTKIHIAQAAHLTIQIPAHWSHTPPLPGGARSIGAEEGFFVASPLVESPDEYTFSEMWGIAEAEVSTTPIAWREFEGFRYECDATEDVLATSALVIPNPHPILTFGGSADHLMLLGDADHFDEIIDSIVFGLDDVYPAELAKGIVEIIHTHSYFRDDIAWDALYDRAAEIESEVEIVDYLQFNVLSKLRSAGDNHSFLRNMDGIVNIATPTVGGQPPNYPTGRIVEGYGYISFPSTNMFTPEYTAEYARVAAELRNDFVLAGVCGWLIDLRDMHGGSVSPPLTALYPFLPDGKIAGFLDVYGNEMWIEKAGRKISPPAYWQDIGDVPWPEGLADPEIPVAVLTGPNNGSAGEFVQLALMSRENLLTFGLSTAGYTTGNIGIPLYNNHHFALASTAEIDVHGNVYTGAIEPDVEDFDIGRGTSVVRANLTTALDWLDQQCF